MACCRLSACVGWSGSAGGDGWSRVAGGCVVVAWFGEAVGGHVAAGDGPLVGLLGEERADEADHCGPVGEDPHDIGASTDLYPALGSRSSVGGLVAFDGAEVPGECVGDVLVAGAFVGPAALVGVVA